MHKWLGSPHRENRDLDWLGFPPAGEAFMERSRFSYKSYIPIASQRMSTHIRSFDKQNLNKSWNSSAIKPDWRRLSPER